MAVAAPPDGGAPESGRMPGSGFSWAALAFLGPAALLLIAFLVYHTVHTFFLSFNRGRGGEFTEWVERSFLLKNAFREVAVIGGLVERQHPGRRKTGRQVSFSTDLIYDVLRKYEPDHLLLRAAWDDARTRLTELGRLVRLVDRAAATMVHVQLDRITPMAVPLMVIVGRESAPAGTAEKALLYEAEALAAAAMEVAAPSAPTPVRSTGGVRGSAPALRVGCPQAHPRRFSA